MPEQKLTLPLQLKSTSDLGEFEGILAVYNNIDLGNDIILPGAIKEFDLTPDGQIRILDAHDVHAPIGKGTLRDATDGLYIKGKLDLAVARAKELLSLMRQGIVNGLSVGFNILPGGQEFRADGVRVLKRISLGEASLVVFPMNPRARVTSVKSIDSYKAIGDLESALRSLGYSKRKAHLCAEHDWPIIRGPEPEASFSDFIETFNSISKEQ